MFSKQYLNHMVNQKKVRMFGMKSVILLRSTVVVNLKFIIKCIIYIDTCATCFELPSKISAMNTQVKGQFRKYDDNGDQEISREELELGMTEDRVTNFINSFLAHSVWPDGPFRGKLCSWLQNKLFPNGLNKSSSVSCIKVHFLLIQLEDKIMFFP